MEKDEKVVSAGGFPKDFEAMTREELLAAIDTICAERDFFKRAAGRLAKEKLIAEKRFLPRFVEANK